MGSRGEDIGDSASGWLVCSSPVSGGTWGVAALCGPVATDIVGNILEVPWLCIQSGSLCVFGLEAKKFRGFGEMLWLMVLLLGTCLWRFKKR